MSRQPEIFDYKKGQELAEAGLSLAVETANKEFPDWDKRCYELFKRWISKKQKGFSFLMEQFRNDCYKWGKIEKPRSERAFGIITKRALKDGLVVTSGTGKVSNVKAHSANASLLVKV